MHTDRGPSWTITSQLFQIDDNFVITVQSTSLAAMSIDVMKLGKLGTALGLDGWKVVL